jgi:PIN domain nuclease of toxin-antitoxin system
VIVLDTHAWLWWVSDPSKLGKAGRQALRSSRAIGVPAICCLEVATLAARGRIVLDRPVMEWLHVALDQPRVDLLPVSPAVAVQAATFPPQFPGDPADRLIAATALLEFAPLITKDERLTRFEAIRTIW